MNALPCEDAIKEFWEIEAAIRSAEEGGSPTLQESERIGKSVDSLVRLLKPFSGPAEGHIEGHDSREKYSVRSIVAMIPRGIALPRNGDLLKYYGAALEALARVGILVQEQKA